MQVNNHQPQQSPQGQRGTQVDVQKVLDNLAPQLGHKDVEIAKLQAALEAKDEHIASLQKLLQERGNGDRVTPPPAEVITGDNSLT